MPLSLRIPSEKEKMIQQAATKAGQSKTAFILAAIDEKLGAVKNRGQTVRELAGWMPHQEAEEMRAFLRVFDEIQEGDWA